MDNLLSWDGIVGTPRLFASIRGWNFNHQRSGLFAEAVWFRSPGGRGFAE